MVIRQHQHEVNYCLDDEGGLCTLAQTVWSVSHRKSPRLPSARQRTTHAPLARKASTLREQLHSRDLPLLFQRGIILSFILSLPLLYYILKLPFRVEALSQVERFGIITPSYAPALLVAKFLIRDPFTLATTVH